ncbi:Histidinol-phosphate transaminase [Ectocarpus siliculosus]|uniref:histidinol-phosphate transaminase n=1 Tax=Ectocarpus siliculosus TaxID=2880 RepID=D7FPJ8_ECTSI|nr:Histidinol-phosphate transaminase [Ectocarpus siliculosus]|eukprot:CBJ30455.1 Histidinol-phosphate transaminase [Ectocarpus siliculosus]
MMQDKHVLPAVATAVLVSAMVMTYVSAKSRRHGCKGEKRQLSDLVRSNIQDLTPYRCARDDYSEGVLLDANENSYGPSLVAGQGTVDLEGLDLNRYPDPQQLEVKALLAEMRGVRPEQIFVGVGSDEAIDLLIRIFCTPGEDSIIVTPPSYGMYKVCAKVNDVQTQQVPLTPDYDVVVSEVLRAATPSSKLLFLCSPGNPTGKSIPASVVRDIVGGGFDGIVVVDEAYVDFSGKDSACSLIDELDTVVVLQTLSKAFGLAAIRMGFAYANEHIIQYMNNVKAPYNVNRLTQEVAVRALKDRSLYEDRVTTILDERIRLQEALRRYSFVKEVKESDANFFLVQVDHAQEIYKRMANNGVVVRFRGNELHCKDCLRVTVGTAAENNRLLELLEKTVAAISAP